MSFSSDGKYSKELMSMLRISREGNPAGTCDESGSCSTRNVNSSSPRIRERWDKIATDAGMMTSNNERRDGSDCVMLVNSVEISDVRMMGSVGHMRRHSIEGHVDDIQVNKRPRDCGLGSFVPRCNINLESSGPRNISICSSMLMLEQYKSWIFGKRGKTGQ